MAKRERRGGEYGPEGGEEEPRRGAREMWRRRDESGSNERKERAWRRSSETIGINDRGNRRGDERHRKEAAAKRGEERRRRGNDDEKR